MTNTAKLNRYNSGEMQLVIWCEGCKVRHPVRVRAAGDVIDATCWGWNADLVRPTITPSIKVTWNWGSKQEPRCCHSFVEDGHIRYLPDCTHALAGQTLPLSPINDDVHDEPEA